MFTDDEKTPVCSDTDLKRLKEGIKAAIPMKPIGMYIVEMEALLARLEACERALKGFVDLEADKMNYDTVVSLLSEWRKAAGK